MMEPLESVWTLTLKSVSISVAPRMTTSSWSTTALAAAGAHIVLFTTGRGTPFACPVPTMKISSNSLLAKKKSNWIDFNAGRVLNGNDCTQELVDFVIDIANGQLAKNEINGYEEISIFKDGVTL